MTLQELRKIEAQKFIRDFMDSGIDKPFVFKRDSEILKMADRGASVVKFPVSKSNEDQFQPRVKWGASKNPYGDIEITRDKMEVDPVRPLRTVAEFYEQRTRDQWNNMEKFIATHYPDVKPFVLDTTQDPSTFIDQFNKYDEEYLKPYSADIAERASAALSRKLLASKPDTFASKPRRAELPDGPEAMPRGDFMRMITAIMVGIVIGAGYTYWIMHVRA